MRRAARLATGVAAFALLAATTAALTHWPADVDFERRPVAAGSDLDAWLAARESAIPGIVPGAGKRISWHGGERGRRTRWVVLYLHGFSATRQETAPLAERLAAQLGANLFETRLTGHGLEAAPLENVTAEDWLVDAREAIAIGERLGERQVVVATSTGATLALALEQAGALGPVAALVLISPNFGPKDPAADLLTWPGGPLLGRMVTGAMHEWTPASEAQGRYWSTRYPLTAVVEMMRLVRAVNAALPFELEAPVLALLSPDDDVIDVPRARAALARIAAPAVEIVDVASGGPSRHVLAGDILAPAATGPLLDVILDFLARQGIG